MYLPIVAALAATALWIVSGTMSKRVTVSLGNIITSAIVVTVGVVPMAISTAVLGSTKIPLLSEAVAAVAGLFLTMGFVLIYKALRTEQLANASVLNELQPAVLVVLGLLALRESIDALQAVCMAGIFIGSILIVTTEKLTINRRLIPAAMAAVSWSVYWVLMAYSEHVAGGAFALPVTISRIGGAAAALVYLAVNRRQAADDVKSALRSSGRRGLHLLLAILIAMAVIDASGDFAFSYVAGSSAVAIGGALSALAPMTVSLMGLLLYRDKMNALQWTGFIVMVAGAVALAVA